MTTSLDVLFRPRSIAVVGASRKRGTIAGEVMHNLVASGFTGAVYPVNPHARSVQSVRAWPSVAAIPDEVDLAVIVLPGAQVLEAVEACGEKGVRALVVVSVGFAEVGPEGRALQGAVLARARHFGMRMVGPNCLGVVNADPAFAMNATFAPTLPPFGNVAFSSQSGALGLALLDHAAELGIGMSQFVSLGNKADVSANDLLEHWGSDASTGVLLFYAESLGNPSRFLRIAKEVSRRKPVVVVKSGRTDAGARAASSHTGSLAGADAAVDALLAQAGVLRAETIEELFDAAMLLSSQPVPRGRRVAILTNAGGPGILASDACERRGLVVPPLGAATEAALAAFLPPEASVKNPVDMIASAPAASYERALAVLAADPDVDAVLVVFVTPIVTLPIDVARAIASGAEGTTKPIATCFMGKTDVAAAIEALRERSFPVYGFPEAAARALAHAARHGERMRSPEGRVPELAVDRDKAARALEGVAKGAWLAPERVNELLAAYGVPTPREATAATRDEAVRVAASVGFPLAVKLVSTSLTHKSDVGGVVLGVSSAVDVAAAWDAIAARLDERGLAGAMQGVLLQEMVSGGVETLVGVTRDPEIGHLVAFGMGGVRVEVWKDVAFRVAPLCDVDARAMLDEIRASALLDGFRGAPPADRDALVDVLLRVSRLVSDFPEVAEIDLNPLTARERGVVAVDARVRRGD